MRFLRGDIILAMYPFSTGAGGSRRPALVIQGDVYNRKIRNTILAQITTNLSRAADPAHLLIEAASVEGRQAGLLHDSVVSCINLATVSEDRIERAIGRLSAGTMEKIEACLKSALGVA